ncbi:MAG: putative C-S lyase [Rhodocyclaceae bacterium]|nr:putative C-S lyase [Rhodocyclaceae bacterium]
MSFDFDTPVDRSGTHSEKYDLRRQLFGTDAVEPLWVADMDFAAPPAVQQALAARVAHPIYGYTVVPDSAPQALADWLARRHGWPVDPAHIRLVPGVVPTLYAAVAALTEPGQGVVVQPPVYPPLFDAVRRQGRVLLENPLRETATGVWQMDLDHLETLAAGGARLLLLCSPHNPVGRVWSRDELSQVLDIARRHGMAILSDEIHADLVYAPRHGAAADAPVHVPLGHLATPEDRVVTALAPSKTFNIPGFGLSATVTANDTLARPLHAVWARLPVSVADPLALAAFEAAYRHGEAWLDACLSVLRANRDALFAAIGAGGAQRVTGSPPEATYLAWLDCRGAGLDDAALMRAWVAAGLGLSAGPRFGTGGSGHMRLNFAIPPSRLAQCIRPIHRFNLG